MTRKLLENNIVLSCVCEYTSIHANEYPYLCFIAGAVQEGDTNRVRECPAVVVTTAGVAHLVPVLLLGMVNTLECLDTKQDPHMVQYRPDPLPEQ